MNYLIIVNQLAGKGISQAELFQIERKFKALGTVRSLLSDSHESTYRFLNSEKDWLDTIVFAGGDGTFRESIQMCVQLDLNVPLVLLAMGTGNDFMRSLTDKRDLDCCFQAAKQKELSKVHYCQLNKNIFLNVASVGLDAAIADYQKKVKKHISGPLSYVISTLLTIINYNNQAIKVTVDNRCVGENYMLVAVANGRYYGGGMRIAPQASPFANDLQIVALETIPKFLLPFIFPLIYFGWHIKLPCVKTWQAKDIIIESNSDRAVNLDGDIMMINYVKIQKNEATQLKIHLLDSLDLHE